MEKEETTRALPVRDVDGDDTTNQMLNTLLCVCVIALVVVSFSDENNITHMHACMNDARNAAQYAETCAWTS